MSNFKNVLKVYTMMRAFDADDNALLNTLRNATEAEIDLLVETVGPAKRTTAKRTRKSSKSSRAASLAGAIGGKGRPSPDAVCTFVHPGGEQPCGQSWTNAVHDKHGGYAGYHEYQPAAAQAAAGGD